MTVTGVGPERRWLPPKPPTLKNQVLMPKADLSGWEPHAWEMRLKPANDQVVQLNTPSGWEDLVNKLGAPSHWTNDHADATAHADGSWYDGAQLTVPVKAGHRYMVLATADIEWTTTSGTQSVGGRLLINNAQVARQTYPGSKKRVTFHQGRIFTAPLDGNLVAKIQYGANSSGMGISLPSSHLDIVEQR